MTDSLPPGWESARLGDLGIEVRGQVSPRPGTTYDLYSVPAFPTGEPERVDGESIKSGKRLVEEHDVLLCKINPRINRVWTVGPDRGRPQVASTEYLVMRPYEPQMAEYLSYYLSGPVFREWIKLAVEGATGSHTRAKSGPILEQVVPVPPLAEQQQIVVAIEEHFSRLDAVEAGLASAAQRTARLLEHVFEEQLRSTNTSSQPLRSFLRERLANGRSVPTAASDGHPVLRLTAIKDGLIDPGEAKLGDFGDTDPSRFAISPDDFLISRGNGSLQLVGRGGLVQAGAPLVAYPDTMIRARVDESMLNPRFLSLVWNERPVRRQLESLARTTAGIYKINQSMIGDVELPVPSLDAQRRLVQAVDEVRPTAAICTDSVDRSRASTRALRRSILSEAFAGRLVSQSSDEESTIALLERISELKLA